MFEMVLCTQMADWAMKKHKGYKKTFDGEVSPIHTCILAFMHHTYCSYIQPYIVHQAQEEGHRPLPVLGSC